MADRSRCRGDVGAKKPGIRWEPRSPHWKGHLLTTVIVYFLGIFDILNLIHKGAAAMQPMATGTSTLATSCHMPTILTIIIHK